MAKRPRIHLHLGIALLVFGLSGCTGCLTHEAGLAEIEGLEIHAQLVSDVVPIPRVWQFDVELYHPNLWDTSCPVLPAQTRVTIDGVAMTEWDDSEGVIRGSQNCYGPYYRVFEDELPPVSEVSTFVADDGETTVTAEFANLFARRSVALISHPSGVVHAGDRATLEVTPATDTIGAPYDVVFIEGESLEACSQRDSGDANLQEGTIEGNRIDFEIPPLSFTRGCLCLRGVDPKILRCEGVGRCLVSVYNFKPGDEPCVQVSVEP